MTTSVTMEVAEANLDAALDLADELQREKAKVARLREVVGRLMVILKRYMPRSALRPALAHARQALADTAPEAPHD